MSSQKGAGSGKGKKPAKSAAEGKREDVLQAVVVTDSFQDRFKPFTIDKPRCLLPLANTPLIEYTFEFLAMNGVQEVFVYPGAHTDQVEDYINRSRWSPDSGKSPFTNLTIIRVSDAHSVGDFLRDLDGRGHISGDFILVHGDLVSTFSLDRALAAHKARKEVTATNIMTVVLRSGGADDMEPDEFARNIEPADGGSGTATHGRSRRRLHRTKAKGITPVFVVDNKTNRLLHYDEMHPLQRDHHLSLDPAVVDELSSDFEVRSDLIDAQVDICTPEVLALWSESFDYELPRRNFLHGVLKDWELNGKAIYADILDDGYAARASNLQLYESVSRDVLSRWTFPFVPDCNVIPGQSYQRGRRGVSAESCVEFATNSEVSGSVLGKDTVIGTGSVVSNCIVGRRCRIGSGVILHDAFIWDDATIDDSTVVTRSIIGNNAVVGKRASVPEGCLLAADVVIDDNTQLANATVLTTLTHSGGPVATSDPKLVGANGKGAAYVDPEDEDDDGGDESDGEGRDPEDPTMLQKSLIYSLAGLSLSSSSISTLSSDFDSDSEVDSHGTPRSGDGASRTRSMSITSDDSTLSASGNTGSNFHHDAVNGLLDALHGDDPGDFGPAKLEFMGLRLSTNASDAQMRRAVAVAFSRRAAELLVIPTSSSVPVDSAAAAAKLVLSRAGAATFVGEVGVAGGEREQTEFVLALQKGFVAAAGSSAMKGLLELPRAGLLLSAVLQKMYELDVLEEEGIVAWWGDKRGEATPQLVTVREKCRVLIEWLEEAEEGDSSEEDDE